MLPFQTASVRRSYYGRVSNNETGVRCSAHPFKHARNASPNDGDDCKDISANDTLVVTPCNGTNPPLSACCLRGNTAYADPTGTRCYCHPH
jgi:hypothetical protein